MENSTAVRDLYSEDEIVRLRRAHELNPRALQRQLNSMFGPEEPAALATLPPAAHWTATTQTGASLVSAVGALASAVVLLLQPLRIAAFAVAGVALAVAGLCGVPPLLRLRAARRARHAADRARLAKGRDQQDLLLAQGAATVRAAAALKRLVDGNTLGHIKNILAGDARLGELLDERTNAASSLCGVLLAHKPPLHAGAVRKAAEAVTAAAVAVRTTICDILLAATGRPRPDLQAKHQTRAHHAYQTFATFWLDFSAGTPEDIWSTGDPLKPHADHEAVPPFPVAPLAGAAP